MVLTITSNVGVQDVLAFLGVFTVLGSIGDLVLREGIFGLKCKPITELTKAQVDGHLPKPIIMVTHGVAPNELPLQILKLGNVLIAGIPAEPTTVAAYRLQETLAQKAKDIFGETPKKVITSSCANAYSQYITTEDEYNAQHYEGASTLFGPHTLAAYQQEFAALLTRST
jgi:neutral ceramidase